MKWLGSKFNYNSALFAFGMFCGIIADVNVSYTDVILLITIPIIFHITQHFCERTKIK